jgi:DNA-binding transcriptional regulator GbsR (MarR family)
MMIRASTAPEPATAPAATDAELQAAQDRFIALWGEMASRWGVPRTVAEVHALLFVAGEPLHVDALLERLRISRGNASMTLRTLVEWGIIAREVRRGDRREYFRAEQDVWRLFATIARARKRREVDPLMEGLARCRTPPLRGRDAAPREAHNARIEELLDAVRLVDGISESLVGADGKGLRRAATGMAKLVGFVAPVAEAITGRKRGRS